MKNNNKGLALGALVAALVVLASSTEILGFPSGAGDGDRLPSACASCHGSTGTGTVDIAASEYDVAPGEVLTVTVTVTEQALTGEGIAGVFLLKGAAGTQESVTADGWTIVRDPSGSMHNYAERSGLSTGVPAAFVWTLSAPSAEGTYTINAVAVHGGDGAETEASAPVAITVNAPQEEAVDPPVISEVAFPPVAEVGSVQTISVRIIDSFDGVRSACICYRTPGGECFKEGSMARTDGTEYDGNWSMGMNVGPSPGAFEFNVTASDTKMAVRSPTNRSFVISVVAPGMPEIRPPALPEKAETDSTLSINARMTDSDSGVKLAVLRYRMPGAADFTTKEMRLVDGTDKDGQWSLDIGTGPSSGAMEVYLAATDGESDVRSPAIGTYTVLVFKPKGPELEVTAPTHVAFGTDPEVQTRASDPLGVVGVQVHFKLAGEASYRVAEMNRRSGDAQNGDWAASIPAGSATGVYSFFVVARNPRSESQSEARTIKVLPDLSVSNVAVSKKDAIVKEETVISALIENRGDRAVTGLSVQFLDLSYAVGDQRPIFLATGVTVPANGNVTVSARWVPQVDGKRAIAVVVDPDRKVEEANEDNNERTDTVPVGLEVGMGVRFPIPSLGDVWVQLTVALGAAAVVGGKIYSGWRKKERQRADGARVKGHGSRGTPGGKQA